MQLILTKIIAVGENRQPNESILYSWPSLTMEKPIPSEVAQLRIKFGAVSYLKSPIENGVCFKYKEIGRAIATGAIFQIGLKLYFDEGNREAVIEFDLINVVAIGPYSKIKFWLKEKIIRTVQLITPMYRYFFWDYDSSADQCEPILHIAKHFANKEQLEKIKNGWAMGIPYWVVTNESMTVVEAARGRARDD